MTQAEMQAKIDKEIKDDQDKKTKAATDTATKALNGRKIVQIEAQQFLDEGGGLFRVAGGVKLHLDNGAVIETDPLFVRVK